MLQRHRPFQQHHDDAIGNFSAIDIQTWTFQVPAPFTELGAVRIYELLKKDGKVQVENTSFRVRSVLDGPTCSGREHILIVKGELKRESITIACG